MIIEPVRRSDWSNIQSIVNHYIDHSVANLKLDSLDEQAFEDWIAQFSASGLYQILVAREAIEAPALGFASCTQFNPRGGYEQTVWSSVYLHPDMLHRGIGIRLYAALFQRLKNEPVHRVLAGITLPNPASVALHEKLGFNNVGVLSEVGFKSGQYHDVLWMQKRMEFRQPTN